MNITPKQKAELERIIPLLSMYINDMIMAGNGHLVAKYISSGNANYLPLGNPIESFNKFLERNNYSEEEQIYYDAYIHQCYVTLINDINELQNK